MENKIEFLDEKLDEVIALKREDLVTFLVDNYEVSDIHIMTRLIRQRKEQLPMKEEKKYKIYTHLEALFNLAEKIVRARGVYIHG